MELSVGVDLLFFFSMVGWALHFAMFSNDIYAHENQFSKS